VGDAVCNLRLLICIERPVEGARDKVDLALAKLASDLSELIGR